MSTTKVYRYISVFERRGDAHVKNLSFVCQPSLQTLQKIFAQDAGDPMYDEYRIAAQIAELLAPLIQEQLDFERFEYFLSCDEVA